MSHSSEEPKTTNQENDGQLPSPLEDDVQDLAQKPKLTDKVPIDSIDISSYQIRKSDQEKGIDELAESLERFGLLHPILVVPDGKGKYKLIAGSRRCRAAIKLGWTEIRATILEDASPRYIALIENIQREDLSILDEACALKELVELDRRHHYEIAKELGKAESWLSETIKITELPQKIKDELPSSPVSKTALITLQRIDEEDALMSAWEELKGQGGSVKAARELVDQHNGGGKKALDNKALLTGMDLGPTGEATEAVADEPSPTPSPQATRKPALTTRTIQRWQREITERLSVQTIEEKKRAKFKEELEALRQLIDERIEQLREQEGSVNRI